MFLRALRTPNTETGESTAVISSNVNTNAMDPLLGEQVLSHTLIELEGGRHAAVISLMDMKHLLPVNRDFAKYYYVYSRALHTELAKLRRLSSGEPDVVVAVVSGFPAAEIQASGNPAKGTDEYEDGLLQLLYEAVGIDVWLVHSIDAMEKHHHIDTATTLTTLPCQYLHYRCSASLTRMIVESIDTIRYEMIIGRYDLTDDPQ